MVRSVQKMCWPFFVKYSIIKNYGEIYMIPFARVLKYGNDVRDTKTIKKMKLEFATSYVLTTDGELYGRGANSMGQLGTGDFVARTEWVLIRREVSNFWTSLSYDIIFIQSTDNRLWYCGNNANLQGIPWSEATNIPVLTEISYFSGRPMKKVHCTPTSARGCTIFLTENGFLYATGNRTGFSSSSGASQSFFSIDNTVDDFAPLNLGIVYIKGSSMYGCGLNQSKIISQSAADNAALNSTLMRTNYSSQLTAVDYSLTYKATNGRVYGIGQQPYGRFGIGNNTSYDGTWVECTGYGSPSLMCQIKTGGSSIYIQNSTFYAVGRNSESIYDMPVQGTTNLLYPVAFSTPFDVSSIFAIYVYREFSSFFYSTNKVYYCGRLSNGAVLLTSDKVISEVPSSFFEGFTIELDPVLMQDS